MGLYIKGMRMPENCEKCMMRDGLFCMTNDYKRISYVAMHRREEWCPLVDLGKHGDLIDRDEVRNAVFHHLSIKGEENLLPAEKSVFGNIIKAKAVIEAEGE